MKSSITSKIRDRGLIITELGLIVIPLFGLAAPSAIAQTAPDAVASFGGQGSSAVETWGCENGIQAYSVVGGVCNLGDAPLYGDVSEDHVMWTSNLYRLYNNRFEQIGMSWIKHDDWTIDLNPCTDCGGGLFDCDGLNNNALDPGCNDTYDACANGFQNLGGGLALGPRSQVNAWTGAWPVVPNPDPGRYCGDISGSSGVLGCRLQVAKADFANYSGAQYFLEEQVITPDETSAARNNNVSYKPATVGSCLQSNCNDQSSPCGEPLSCTNCGSGDGCVYALKAGTGGCSTHSNCDDGEPCTNDRCEGNVCQHNCTSYFTPDCQTDADCNDSDSCTTDSCVQNPEEDFFCEYTCPGPCIRCCEEPAIKAWKDADSSVVETEFQAMSGGSPVDGKFILAAKAWNVAGCVWEYEYALYNMNSDRSARAFKVPTDLSSADITDRGFHDISYHSGEPYSTTDWTDSVTGGYVTWSTELESENPDANALRWGTLYNFRFRAPRPPNNSATVTIDLFKSGTPSSVTGASIAPATSSLVGACCKSGGCCVTTQTVCTSQGGSFKGVSTDCQDCNLDEVADRCQPLTMPFRACCLPEGEYT